MHPKNGLKLTGNTHLPDVMDDLYETDEPRTRNAQETRVYADGYEAPVAPETLAALREEPGVPEPTRMQKVERQAGRVGGRAPWVLIVGGLLLGTMAARLLRRD